MKSLRSLFRRIWRKILRTLSNLNRNEIIVIATIAAGIILTTAIVLVLLNNGSGHDGDSSLDISVQEDDSDNNPDDQTTEEITLTETASAETKVESTEETTILVTKENAQKGYMNRCVFLGDSRTVAMVNYGLINDDSALAQIGISHPSFSGNTFVNNAGKQYTLKSYLASHQAPVIYIALGVNGINDPSEDHYKKTFVQLIDSVMEQAPNSNIVLMSIGPVNDNGMYKKTVQNSWIVKYNDFLLETAKEKHIFYLDISEVLTGSDGQVKPEYNGGDGLHYSGSGCQAIFDYIVSHPVPGISDDGEYNVKYIKPNPNNTKVTMDDGSGIDESKLEELMNMMMEETPTATPTATPTPAQTTPSPEELKKQEEERKKKEEEEARKAREEEEELKRKKKLEEEERLRREQEAAAAEAAKKAAESAANSGNQSSNTSNNGNDSGNSGNSGGGNESGNGSSGGGGSSESSGGGESGGESGGGSGESGGSSESNGGSGESGGSSESSGGSGESGGSSESSGGSGESGGSSESGGGSGESGSGGDSGGGGGAAPEQPTTE